MICYYSEYLSGGRFGDSPFLAKARREMLKSHNTYLDTLAEPLRSAGIAVETAAISNRHRHEGIVRHAIERKADMILKDTHHHAALSRALFSHTDWNLIRNCPMPLWLVKPRDIFNQPTFIVAIDTTMNDRTTH